MIYYCGIDNGVSGSIGITDEGSNGAAMYPMPTFSEQDYTKSKKNVTRISTNKLRTLLDDYINQTITMKFFLEIPMVNPGRFVATASALRAWEATLIVIKPLGSRYYMSSREWQKVMLPAGVKGPEELKRASREVGVRLFPSLEHEIIEHGDADGLLLAEYARRQRL